MDLHVHPVWCRSGSTVPRSEDRHVSPSRARRRNRPLLLAGLLLLLGHSPIFAVSYPPVLEGPFVNPMTGRGYLVIHAHGLNSARAYAEVLGGTLAAINDSDEQDYLETLDLLPYVRIGLVSTPAGWVWDSGDPVQVNNWGSPPTTAVNFIATGITNWQAIPSVMTGPFLIERPTAFPTESSTHTAERLANGDVQLGWSTALPATIEIYRNGEFLASLPAGVQEYVDPAPDLPAEYMVVLNSFTEEQLPMRSYVPDLNDNFSFRITDGLGVDSAIAVVESTHTLGDIQGYSAAISHDPHLTISAVTEGDSALAATGGGSWYFSVDTFEHGVVVNTIFSISTQVTLSPGTHSLLELTVESPGMNPPQGGELFFCDWLDELSTQLIAVTGGTAHRPYVTSGSVSYSTPFLRGDCNGDGTVNITDPIYLIDRLFDTLPYSCVEACDANDDAGVNVADVVYSLGTLFVGTPPPPAPYPECGLDPDPGTRLPCDAIPNCP